MGNDTDLKKRIANPNKDFDSLMWRPKSRWARRLVARYIDYITVFGYLFVLALVAGIIALWAVPSRTWVDGGQEVELRPAITPVSATGPGHILQMSVVTGEQVDAGRRLCLLQPTGNAAPVALRAPCSGVVYPAPSRPDSGLFVDAQAHLFDIVDFSTLTATVTVSGGRADSVGIGDSVSLMLVGSTRHHEHQHTEIVVSTTGRDGRAGALLTPFPSDMLDSLTASLKGVHVRSKHYAPHSCSRVLDVQLLVSADGSLDTAASADILVADQMLGGHVIDGERTLEVEKASGFPEETRARLQSWAEDAIQGRSMRIDDGDVALDSVRSVRFTARIRATQPLSEPLAPANPDRTVSADVLKGFRVEAVVRLANPPEYCRALARALYESPTPAFLLARVKINALTTTWGRRLLNK